MPPIDALTKHFVQTYPHHFLQFTFQRDDIQLVEILPTEQTTVETRHLDTLFKVRIDGQPALVHYEFQTTDSTPAMPRRMASYIGRLIEQYGLPVYAHVIYLRPDAGKNDPGSYIQEHPLYPIRIHYAVLRLADLPGETVRDGRLFGLLPVATLMQPPPGTNPDQWLTECMAMTRELPLDSPAKANMALGLAFYSSLTYDKQHLSILLSKERLMALVKESDFARDFLDMLRRNSGTSLGVKLKPKSGRKSRPKSEDKSSSKVSNKVSNRAESKASATASKPCWNCVSVTVPPKPSPPAWRPLTTYSVSITYIALPCRRRNSKK